MLDDSDCGLLEDAALKARNELHSAGLRDMDVDVRNMGARREVDEDGVVRWRVLLIDVGFGRYSGDEDDVLRDKCNLHNACV